MTGIWFIAMMLSGAGATILHNTTLHSSVFRTSIAERRVTDPVLAAKISHIRASLVFLQNPDDLFFDWP